MFILCPNFDVGVGVLGLESGRLLLQFFFPGLLLLRQSLMMLWSGNT
jgi:hypothetical protein